MKVVIAILLFSFALHAKSHTIYIDPDCKTNGNGSTQNCSDSASGPRNSWAGITYVPGNAYLGKAGKAAYYAWCNFKIDASGSDALHQITLGSYGTGKHTIVCESGYVFGETQRSWITFDNLDLTALSNQCLLLQGSGNVMVKNLTFRYCASYGIGLDGANCRASRQPGQNA